MSPGDLALATGMRQGVKFYSECRITVRPTPARETMDDGAIASIVVGVIVCLAFVVVMGIVCRRRRVTTVVHRSTVSAPVQPFNPGYTTTVVQTGGGMQGTQQTYPGGLPTYGASAKN